MDPGPLPRPRLETARLLLRPFELGDAVGVEELAGDPAIADTTLNIPHPYPPGGAVTWIERMPGLAESGQALALAICERPGSAAIGAIGLNLRHPHRAAEMGYWVGRPYWNRGYMTEAAGAVLSFGFSKLGLNRIYATAFVRNPGSWRVMEKLGMKREGLMRQQVLKWDRFEDVLLYAILVAEYRARV